MFFTVRSTLWKIRVFDVGSDTRNSIQLHGPIDELSDILRFVTRTIDVSSSRLISSKPMRSNVFGRYATSSSSTRSSNTLEQLSSRCYVPHRRLFFLRLHALENLLLDFERFGSHRSGFFGSLATTLFRICIRFCFCIYSLFSVYLYYRYIPRVFCVQLIADRGLQIDFANHPIVFS